MTVYKLGIYAERFSINVFKKSFFERTSICFKRWLKVRESVHFLNFLYHYKDYANFDSASSIIMKNFPESVGLETNSSLQDGSKSENSDWERDVLNLKKDVGKIVKSLIFRITLPMLLNNCKGKCPQIPKMSLFKKGI